jgi:hypothetical protein
MPALHAPVEAINLTREPLVIWERRQYAYQSGPRRRYPVALRGGLTEAGSMRLLLQHPLHMLLIFLSTSESSELSLRMASSPCIAGP